MTPVRFLVVDDNPSMRNLFELMIRQMGFGDVHFAGNGNEALRMCDANRYEVIVLDNIMPRMNGVDFLRTYRSNRGTGKQATVIMVTAFPDEAVMSALRDSELGIADVILKPFDIAVLKERIQRVIGRARRSLSGAGPVTVTSGEPEWTGYVGPLSSEVVVRDGVAVVMLVGSLSFQERTVLTALMDTAAVKSAPTLAFDITKIGHIDEFGIGSLLVINGILAAAGKRFHLVAGEGYLRNRLEATWLSRLIPISSHWSELFDRRCVEA